MYSKQVYNYIENLKSRSQRLCYNCGSHPCPLASEERFYKFCNNCRKEVTKRWDRAYKKMHTRAYKELSVDELLKKVGYLK